MLITITHSIPHRLAELNMTHTGIATGTGGLLILFVIVAGGLNLFINQRIKTAYSSLHRAERGDTLFVFGIGEIIFGQLLVNLPGDF